jgi:hypothetical protein
VKFHYQDMVGSGPAAVMTRNALNKPERIVFSGRSQISQPTKRWIADRIEMYIADKRIVASGNTKAIILHAPAPAAQPAPPPEENSQLAKAPPKSPPQSPAETNSKVAEPPGRNTL